MALRMILTAAFLAAAANMATAEISGHYRMDSVDTKGVTYAGTADISMSSESNCRIMYSDGFEGKGNNLRRVLHRAWQARAGTL